MKIFLQILLMVIILFTTSNAQFAVYYEFSDDARFQWINQPSQSYLESLGMHKAYVSFDWELVAPDNTLIESGFRNAVQRIMNSGVYLKRVCFDVESIEINPAVVGNTTALANAHILAKGLGWAKNSRPDAKVGYYSVLPDTKVWDSWTSDSTAWKAGNDLVHELSDSATAIFPSIYLFYPESVMPYERYAVPMIREAKRIAKGKPVCAFVSPQYHFSTENDNSWGALQGQPHTADSSVFAKVLYTIKNAGADAIYIFGGHGSMGSHSGDWNGPENKGWENALIAFLKKNILDVNDTLLVIPTDMMLFQNYPNPFNPITKIRYSISISSQVKLQVFDVLGQKVFTLIDTYQNPGEYSVNFNGMILPSGIYFYQLQSNNNIRTKVLVIQK